MLKFSFGAIIIAGVATLGFAGFRGQKMEHTPVEWFNDMAHQPKNQPQHHSGFFNDGRAARQPVAGTVPIGFTLEGRYDQTGASNLRGSFTNAPDYFNTGAFGVVYGDGIPEQLAAKGEALLQRGQERYDISCAICHGKAGQGNGVVKAFGLMTIPPLTTAPMIDQPDGRIFATITHGRSTMGAYGPVISVEDRWAIVAYVRALQTAAQGKLTDLPEAEQKKLQEQK